MFATKLQALARFNELTAAVRAVSMPNSQTFQRNLPSLGAEAFVVIPNEMADAYWSEHGYEGEENLPLLADVDSAITCFTQTADYNDMFVCMHYAMFFAISLWCGDEGIISPAQRSELKACLDFMWPEIQPLVDESEASYNKFVEDLNGEGYDE